MRHNPWLDWLRFLAALEVVLTHARTQLFTEYAQLAPHNPLVAAWAAATRCGYEAVMVFFVLSGFLVGGRALEQARAGTFRIEKYAIDRAVRIFVPLTAAIAFTTILALSFGLPVSTEEVVGNLLSVQGALAPVMRANYPLWSLSYEVWFYLSCGAVAYLLLRRNIVPSLVILTAATGIFTLLNPLYLLLWVGGAIFYLYRPQAFSIGRAAAGGAVTLIGLALHQLSLPNSANTAGVELGQVAGGGFILIGMGLLIQALNAAKRTGGKFGRLGTFLASFSYSLYLIHLPLLEVLPVAESRTVNLMTISAYVLVVLMALVAGYLFSRCFEATGPAIKKWLRQRLAVDQPVTDSVIDVERPRAPTA